ncbi:MAG: hypothetical protein JW791_02590 [Nanoarchaeota archaeon]|nr:hypothetical protein [Nanoarchaeota archaeon]
MKKLFLLLFLLPIAFGAANINVDSASYTYVYSNSLSRITFTLVNNGDEAAYLTNKTLNGFSNYNIYFSPDSIPAGSSAEVIFEVSIGCEPRDNLYEFFANFTYDDSSGTKIANSTLYTILTASPLIVEISSPEDINTIIGIQTDDVGKLLYSVSNNGFQTLNFNVSVNYEESIFSEIITSKGDYSTSHISNEVFHLQPGEDIIFSHSLIPVMSGASGFYTVYLTDEECVYNRVIINFNYEVFSSSRGGFNIIVADESNYLIIFLSIVFISLLFYRRRINS